MQRFIFIALLYIGLTFFATDVSAQSKPQPTLNEKIGQMIIIGFRGMEIADTNHVVRDIKKYNLGGVILFDYDVPRGVAKRNIESPKQLKILVDQIKNLADRKMLVAIDQEGGKVSRLKTKYGFPHSVSAQYLGSFPNTDSTKYYAEKTAKTLSDLGINMNFAPVVDVNINPENPIIGKLGRSFSSNPQKVVKHAAAYIRGLHKHSILSVIKHFPGHGSSQKDSHLGVVDVSDTWSRKELVPYRRLIDRNLPDAIMTAHIFNENIDPNWPATLSRPTITGLLRYKLGYKGVVISDDLMMGAIRKEYGLKTTIKQALNAGVDLMVFGNNSIYDPNIVPKTHRIVKELLESGDISRKQIDASYKRIIEMKRKIN